jgi:hypothetical protein
LWAADVPGKVKVHYWRLLRNGLAVGEELRRRRIKDGVACIACARPESLFHRFWDCPFSSQVWAYMRDGTGLSLPCPSNEFRSHAELQGWMLDWLGKLQEKELSAWLLTMYHIWLARNKARDLQVIEHPEQTAKRVAFSLGGVAKHQGSEA